VIPDRVIEVLRGPSVIWLGTRDRELRPAHAYATAAVVHDDRQTVTFFVSEGRSKRALADLEDNARVALAFGQASHEAYQLKGSYLSSRAASDAEYALMEAYREKVWRGLAQYWPEELVKPMILGASYRPSIAITFRVEEVYLQTPGPGAGSRMDT
jgi:hypothetical protein